jgi:hydrogenase/urease accessory protein HupE
MSVLRLVALAGVLVAATAHAHTISTALAVLALDGATVTYRLTFVVTELSGAPREAFAAAERGDPAAAARAVELLRDTISVRSEAGPCAAGRASVQGSTLGDSRLTLMLSYHCSRPPARLSIRDDSFDVFGEHHQTLARVETPAGVREAAFSPGAREVSIDLGAAPRRTLAFVRLGVEHILTGWDHLLFLAALLLGGGGAVALLKIVTAFTIAHSVSLAAAVLGLVHVPERVIESVIAASIAWVAIENVVRRALPVRRWVTSFVFGLVHGLGFASALTPLALPTWGLAGALVGFNVGVEAGQAVVIALVLPASLWLRGREVEPRLRRGLSIGVAAIGSAWFVWRLFFG